MSDTTNPCANPTTCPEKRTCIRSQLANKRNEFKLEVKKYFELKAQLASLREDLKNILLPNTPVSLVLLGGYFPLIPVEGFASRFQAALVIQALYINLSRSYQAEIQEQEMRLLLVGNEINSLCKQLTELTCSANGTY